MSWLIAAAILAPGEIEAWARTLAHSTAQAPSFVLVQRALQQAETSKELGAALPPFNLAVGVDHGESAANLGDWERATTNAYARGDVYLPFGANLSSSLVVGWNDSPRPGADLSLAVDLLRDLTGRFTRAQRGSAVASAEAQLHQTRALAEETLRAMLALALDVCVQEELISRTEEVMKLAAESLRTAEQRAKIGLARESDVLQVRASVLGTERALNDLVFSRDALVRSFQATYGNAADLGRCPTLQVDGAKTAHVQTAMRLSLDSPAPQLASRSADVKGATLRLQVAELALLPTLSPFARVTGAGVFDRRDALLTPVISDSAAWTGVLGVELTWQLGNAPGQLGARLARETLGVSGTQREQTLLALEAELAQIVTQMHGLETALEIVQRQRTNNAETLRLLRVRYEVGSSSSFELSGAYQNFAQSETVAPPLLAQWQKLYWRALVLLGELRGHILGTQD